MLLLKNMDVNMIYLRKKKETGFTLLEMLISITLFTAVTTIAFTALFSIINANDKAKTIKLVVNNLSIAMESMAREIRVGSSYTCERPFALRDIGRDCINGGNRMSFVAESGENIFYSYDSVNRTINRKIDNDNTLQMVGQDIKIDNLDFYVVGNGTETPASIQPRVLIILKGSLTSQGQNIETIFDIQTTVSQRNLER